MVAMKNNTDINPLRSSALAHMTMYVYVCPSLACLSQPRTHSDPRSVTGVGFRDQGGMGYIALTVPLKGLGLRSTIFWLMPGFYG